MKEEDGNKFMAALQDLLKIEAELETSGETLHVQQLSCGAKCSGLPTQR